MPPAVAAAARATQQQRDPRAALPADPPDGAPEIVAELFVSPTTAKTQMRHLYVKLGAHSRAEAVEKGQRTLTPEDIQSKNVELNSSLKNWVVILDHDIDDPIMSIHTTAPPETAPPE